MCTVRSRSLPSSLPRKIRQSWKRESNRRVEVDAGHVDGVANRLGLNDPLGQKDGERWHDLYRGDRLSLVRLVHDAAGGLRSARCSRWYGRRFSTRTDLKVVYSDNPRIVLRAYVAAQSDCGGADRAGFAPPGHH